MGSKGSRSVGFLTWLRTILETTQFCQLIAQPSAAKSQPSEEALPRQSVHTLRERECAHTTTPSLRT